MADVSCFILMVVLFTATTSCYTLTQGSSNIRHSYYKDTLYVSSFSAVLPEHLAQNLIIRHDSLVFERDSIVLHGSGTNALDELLALLYSNERLTIEIIGYSELGPARSDTYPYFLSESRARYVRDFLVNNLVAPERISSSAYDGDPVYHNGRRQRGPRIVDIRIIAY